MFDITYNPEGPTVRTAGPAVIFEPAAFDADGQGGQTAGLKARDSTRRAAADGRREPMVHAMETVDIDGTSYARMHRHDGWVHLESRETGRCLGVPGPDGTMRLPTTDQLAGLVAEGRAAVRADRLRDAPDRRGRDSDRAMPGAPLTGEEMVSRLMTALSGKSARR